MVFALWGFQVSSPYAASCAARVGVHAPRPRQWPTAPARVQVFVEYLVEVFGTRVSLNQGIDVFKVSTVATLCAMATCGAARCSNCGCALA